MTHIARLALTLLLPAQLAGAAPAIVAVFDLENRAGLGRREAHALTDYVTTRLTQDGHHQVVARADLQEAMRARKADSYKACYDESCQIEIGRELAAQKSLSTKISRVGKQCLVTMQLFDLALSTTERAGSARGGCRMESIFGLIDRAVADLNKARASGPKVAPDWVMPKPPRDLDGLNVVMLRALVARPVARAADEVRREISVAEAGLVDALISPRASDALIQLARLWEEYSRSIRDTQGTDAANRKIALAETVRYLNAYVARGGAELDEALFMLGLAQGSSAEAGATTTLTRLVKEHPASTRRAAALFMLSQLRMVESDARGAEAALLELAEHESEPAAAYARFALAWIHANRGDARAAVGALKSAKALAEKLPEAVAWRAPLLEEIAHALDR